MQIFILDANYDENIEINLDTLEPHVNWPFTAYYYY